MAAPVLLNFGLLLIALVIGLGIVVVVIGLRLALRRDDALHPGRRVSAPGPVQPARWPAVVGLAVLALVVLLPVVIVIWSGMGLAWLMIAFMLITVIALLLGWVSARGRRVTEPAAEAPAVLLRAEQNRPPDVAVSPAGFADLLPRVDLTADVPPPAPARDTRFTYATGDRPVRRGMP